MFRRTPQAARRIVARMSTVQLESIRPLHRRRGRPPAPPRGRRPSTTPRPATSSARCCSPSPPTSTPRCRRPRRRSRAGATSSVVRRARVMFAFRELVDAAHSTSWRGSSPPSTARSLEDAKGEVIRGMEVVEFACGIAAAAQGRVLRPGLDRRRLCTRSASRSACAPGSRRSTSRSWCRCGCTRSRSPTGNTFVLKPSERDPSASQPRRRAVRRGRPAGRRLQRRPRRQGRGRRAARPPGRRRGLASSARPRSPSTSTSARPRAASGCRRSAGRRTTPS